MHFTISNCFKSVITVMSSLSADITLLSESVCPAVTQLAKLCFKSNTSLQLEMKMLMTKLDSLLFLENAELYCNSWNEFKIKVAQLTAECTVNIDNQHITKLIQTVKILVISQKKSVSTALIFYAAVFKNLSVWADLSIVCKISTHLVRKLMITCSDTFLQDWKHSVKQIMKKINKFKDNIVSEKVLTI